MAGPAKAGCARPEIEGEQPIPDFVPAVVVGKEITIKAATGAASGGWRSAIRTLKREIPGDESIHSCLLPALGPIA